jgi:hypothetical protein
VQKSVNSDSILSHILGILNKGSARTIKHFYGRI